MVADQQRTISPSESRAALENITHLTQKICGIWGTPELDVFLSELIMDARGGARQGLPVAVAGEILFLAQANKMLRAMDLSKKQNIGFEQAYRLVDDGDETRLKFDAMDDPTVSRDTVTRRTRSQEIAERHSAVPSSGSQAQGLGDLLLMLIRSKWLWSALALALGLKFIWPTVKFMI